jgi:hypothetical protein
MRTAELTRARVRLCGRPMLLDAAQFASRAHWVRSYWTNLVDAEHLECVHTGVRHPAGGTLAQVMAPGCPLSWCGQWTERPGWATPATRLLASRFRVLPSLVSFPASYAFRNGGPGLVQDAKLGSWRCPPWRSVNASWGTQPALWRHLGDVPAERGTTLLVHPWRYGRALFAGTICHARSTGAPLSL